MAQAVLASAFVLPAFSSGVLRSQRPRQLGSRDHAHVRPLTKNDAERKLVARTFPNGCSARSLPVQVEIVKLFFLVVRCAYCYKPTRFGHSSLTAKADPT